MSGQSDEKEIRTLLESALTQVSWNSEKAPDWDSFLAPYLEFSAMVPSARPACGVTPDAFRSRMESQRESGDLSALEERPVGSVVRVFGNVAVALSSFGAIANQGAEGFGINAFLLVKTEGEWRIVATAWDNAASYEDLPRDLRAEF